MGGKVDEKFRVYVEDAEVKVLGRARKNDCFPMRIRNERYLNGDRRSGMHRFKY
jgi:hypothetical protein